MLLISKTILSRNKQTEDRAAVPEKCKMFGKIVKCNIDTISMKKKCNFKKKIFNIKIKNNLIKKQADRAAI